MIKRTRSGKFEVRLKDEERALLRSIPGELRAMISAGEGDESLRRLFPPAYTDEPELDAEYQRLMGEDLRKRHLEALEVMEATIDAKVLDEEQTVAWLSALNDVRLFLGTRLDVTEDTDFEKLEPSDPRYGALAVYGWLGWLEESIVEALARAL